MILMKRHLNGRRLSGLALAAAIAAATASEGAFAMLTSADVEHMNRETAGNQDKVNLVDLGRPGPVILEPEPRSGALDYQPIGGRVGRIPVDRQQ